MDPASVSLASAAVTLLVPYLKKSGEAIAGELGKNALSAVKDLYSNLRDWLKGEPDANKALDALAQSPESEDAASTAKQELAKVIAANPALAQNISGLIEQANAAGAMNQINVKVEGENAKVMTAGTNFGPVTFN